MKAISDLTVGVLSLKDLVFLSKEYSILQNVLDKMKNKSNTSVHSVTENILNSSLFLSDKSKSLSCIEEEEKSVLDPNRKIDANLLESIKLPIISKFSPIIPILTASGFMMTNNSEILDQTLILDFSEVNKIKSQLPPISLMKDINQDDFSDIQSQNQMNFDEEEEEEYEISLNFLINEMECSEAALSFRLNDELDEEERAPDYDLQDQAVLEISSYLMKSEESSQMNLIQEKISFKRKFSKILRDTFSWHFLKRKEVKVLLLFYINLFNAFYVPLSLIFDSFAYPVEIMVIEIMNVLYLSYLFIKKAIKYSRAFKRRNDHQTGNAITGRKLTADDENAIILQLKTLSEIYLTLFYECLYVIPFPLIISKLNLGYSVLKILSVFRLVNVKYIIRGLANLKQKNSILGSILQILILSIVFIHLFACILIAIAFSQADFNHSFLRRMPAPEYSFSKETRESLDVSDKSIYIHCLYWVYATVSKSGVMEMQVVDIEERIFSIFVMTIGGLFYIFVFGNMVSLVEDLTPKMKSILEKQEKKVLKLVRNLNMKGLERKLENYFNHIWKSNKGFNENELLENLPIAIKVDIQKCQYLQIFKKSKFFSHGKLIPRPDSSLIYSLFKFLQSEVFIPEDVIIIAGEYCSKIYFILEGRVELISFDLKNKIPLQSGDFFGGIKPFERQPGYARALTFCKIGSLDRETFEIMKESFPLWNQKMVIQMESYKTILLRDLSFFKDEIIMLDSGILKEKIIEEKVIEYYYPIYLKLEKEISQEKKNEKVIRSELDTLKNSSRKTPKTEQNDPFLMPTSSKRTNIVNLMNKSNFPL